MANASRFGSSSSGNVTDQDGVNVKSPYHLQNSDHPGMVLVSNSLTGFNYISYSRAMTIALGAKTKLGFADGSCLKQADEDPLLKRWIKVDYMVTSWILNSISKEIVEVFLYISSSYTLWQELQERYGECNGPLLYQFKREICSINQGGLTISIYYTKLKKLWDEVVCLAPIPTCKCGASSKIVVLDSNDKLMQFLMGLNDIYDHVRNQILVMDPFPTVNKAYSMILRVKKQKEVNVSFSSGLENAMMLKYIPNKSAGTSGKGTFRKNVNKDDSFCEYCKAKRHTKDTCFKLHGITYWYKKGIEKRSNGDNMKSFANMLDSPLDVS
ncbi:hypothetical protein Scep_003048 [Stephania cephalantha]|uniref:Retrotransposon Copia-like N-terminal domain-containing protein n=1 Tax=Stephania cephalantha TaxID=152367 RepID=A0AAP0Q4W8_9MAGN